MKLYQIYYTSSIPSARNLIKLAHLRIFFAGLIVHFCYYCSKCLNSINNIATSTCSVCKMAFSSINDFSYFVHFSVSDQIKSLFTRKHCFTNLQHRFSRVKVHETNYEDVYDGHLYQELMVPNGF